MHTIDDHYHLIVLGRSKAKDMATSTVSQDKIPRWSLYNWLIFLNERAPPLIFVLLASGPCLSGLVMTQGFVDLEKAVWAIVGCTVVLLTVRVMDDVKDYTKDQVVHPDRPLPRGLLRYEEARRVVILAQVAMVGYGLLLGVRFGWLVGLFFILQVFYTFLMYIEFGIGDWLEERPFLYAITHQLSIFVMAMFIGELGGASWNSWAAFLMGSIALSGFFTYEICRKLDPSLPKIKGTYLIVCGKWPTFFFTVGTVLIGVASSYASGLHWMLWPLEGFMILSLLFLFLLPETEPKPKNWKPKAHKPVEGLAVIYILLHMWAPFIASFF